MDAELTLEAEDVAAAFPQYQLLEDETKKGEFVTLVTAVMRMTLEKLHEECALGKFVVLNGVYNLVVDEKRRSGTITMEATVGDAPDIDD